MTIMVVGTSLPSDPATSFNATRRSVRNDFTHTDGAGESGLGKTTLINTLFATEICSPRNYRHRSAKQLDKTTEIEILKADLEERGFNIKVCSPTASVKGL